MFTNHNKLINEYAQASADNLESVVMMVALSIQQPWSSIGNQIKDWREHGTDSRFVWGNKLKTALYLQEHKDRLYSETVRIISECRGHERAKKLLRLYLDIDGMGLVKAGFIVQLVSGQVGCIDSHNLKRLKVSTSAVSISKGASEATISKKVNGYVELCYSRRSSWLWDSWCKLIADKYPKKFADASEVSEKHYTYLVGA